MGPDFVVKVCNRAVCGHCVLAAMRDHGGSFVQILADLWWAADPFNKGRIVCTFSEYFEEYAKNVIIWRIECEDKPDNKN